MSPQIFSMTKEKQKRLLLKHLKEMIAQAKLDKELKELNTKLQITTTVGDVENLHPDNLRKYSILMYRKIQVLEKLN